MQKTQVQSLGQEDSPGEENGNLLQYSAWEIPWAEEFIGLQSMDLQSAGHGLATRQQQGVCCCSGFSPVGVSWGCSSVEVLGLRIAGAEHGL